MPSRVAVLGTGKMGEALLSGMLRAGKPPGDLVLTARRRDRAELLQQRYGVVAVGNIEAAKAADTLILTVKPQDMAALLEELGSWIPADRLVISVAAGIPTAFIESRLADGVPVVRVMSNTPVLVDEAMSAISAGAHPDEAMTDAGILLGLPRAVAHDLIVQSAIGAAVMLRDSGEHPVKLREAVTSPGGTTINAIRELENHRVRAAFLAAIEAARDRAQELGSVS